MQPRIRSPRLGRNLTLAAAVLLGIGLTETARADRQKFRRPSIIQHSVPQVLERVSPARIARPYDEGAPAAQPGPATPAPRTRKLRFNAARIILDDSYLSSARISRDPASPAIAAGPTHIVEATNEGVLITSRATSPPTFVSFKPWFVGDGTGLLEDTALVKNRDGQPDAGYLAKAGDVLLNPRVVYDKFAGRFVLVVGRLDPSGTISAVQPYTRLQLIWTAGSDPTTYPWSASRYASGDPAVQNAYWVPRSIMANENTVCFTADAYDVDTGDLVEGDFLVFDKRYLEDPARPPAYIIGYGPAGAFNPATLHAPAINAANGSEFYLGTLSPEDPNLANTTPEGASLIARWRIGWGAKDNPDTDAVLDQEGWLYTLPGYAAPPNAPQPAPATHPLEAGDGRATGAGYGGGFLEVVGSLDASGTGIIQAFRLAVPPLGSPFGTGFSGESLDYFGFEGIHSLYPNVGINGEGSSMYVFGISGSDFPTGILLQPWQVGGTLEDPDGFLFSPYDNGSTVVPWGDYNGIALDPAGNSFWTTGQVGLETESTASTWATLVLRSAFKNLTVLTVDPAAGVIGETVDLAATLTKPDGSPISGETVEFKVDGATVGSGVTDSLGFAKVAYAIPEGAVGSHTIDASLAESGTSLAASGTNTLTVAKSDTTLVAQSVIGAKGQKVTLTATLTRNSDGAGVSGRTVVFKVDGAAVASGPTDGAGIASVVFTIPTTLANGAHVLTAVFDGSADPDYNSSASAAAVLKVATKTRTTLLGTSPLTGKVGVAKSYSAKLVKASNGAPLANRKIEFLIDGVLKATKPTNSTGVATFSYKPPAGSAGSHTLMARFNPPVTSSYAPSKASKTLIISP